MLLANCANVGSPTRDCLLAAIISSSNTKTLLDGEREGERERDAGKVRILEFEKYKLGWAASLCPADQHSG